MKDPRPLQGLWFALGIAALAFLAHASSLASGFVYDDHRFIEQNPAIHEIQPLAYFTDGETASATEGVQPDIYRPLRTLLFSLEYAAFGLDPFGWHLVSVLLHVVNAVLVFLLLRLYLGWSLWPGAIGAALFAVHPMTSESVAWVSSQGDLLALTFMLSALWVFRAGGVRRTVAGSGLFLLACFAKESALVLPALVFLQSVVLRRAARADAPCVRTSWIRVGIATVLIALYFWARITVVPTVRQIPYPGGLAGTLRGMFEGLTWYGSMLVWPQGFPFDLQYAPPLSWSEPRVVAGIGLFVTMLLAGLHALRAGKARLAFVVLGFLACLVPVSNVIVPLKTFIADRFLYPGLFCLALGTALMAAATWRIAKARLAEIAKPVTAILAVVPIAVFAVLAFQRGGAYADEMTLWKRVRADRPTNANAYHGIAFELARKAEISDAERAFRTYIAFNPIDGKAWMILGDTFARVARSLDPNQEIAKGSNMAMRQKQAFVAQISAYREAFRIWQRFGFARGRGSPEMQRRMFVRWFGAAGQLGDVMEMKRVNDVIVQAYEGVDPTDPEAFWTKAGWRARVRRFLIATRVFDKKITETAIPREHLDRALADRAQAFRDVRLDPNQPDAELMLPFRRFVATQTLEADKAGARVSAADFAVAVGMVFQHDREMALALVKRGLARYPKDTGLGAQLQALSR